MFTKNFSNCNFVIFNLVTILLGRCFQLSFSKETIQRQSDLARTTQLGVGGGQNQTQILCFSNHTELILSNVWSFCLHVYPNNGVRRVEEYVLMSVIARVSRSRCVVVTVPSGSVQADNQKVLGCTGLRKKEQLNSLEISCFILLTL